MPLRLLSAAALTLALLFTGCATEKGMAVLDTPAAITKSSKPIYLMTVTLRNTYVPAYQPKLQAVRVLKKTDSPNPKIILFQADPLAKSESDSAAIGSSYLLRMEIEPGDYTILGLDCVGQSMSINGEFFAPIEASLRPATPGVYYLGHIEATVREHKGNEFRASGKIPVQEQRLVGAYGGTFDIEITNRLETDNEKFLTKFPALKGINIHLAVLPSFNRPRVQAWWEKNGFNDMP
jgi:hypothetical protein